MQTSITRNSIQVSRTPCPPSKTDPDPTKFGLERAVRSGLASGTVYQIERSPRSRMLSAAGRYAAAPGPYHACMKICAVLCQLGMVFASIQVIPAMAAEHKIRALIVDGFSNHDWNQTTVLLRGVLKAAGGFEVSVSTAPIDPNTAAWAAWRPRFADYDVVIQTCNEGAMNGLLTGVKPKPDWPDAVKRDFVDFVRNGG